MNKRTVRLFLCMGIVACLMSLSIGSTSAQNLTNKRGSNGSEATAGYSQAVALSLYRLFCPSIEYIGEYQINNRFTVGGVAGIGYNLPVSNRKGWYAPSWHVAAFGRYYMLPYYTQGVKGVNGLFAEATFRLDMEYVMPDKSQIGKLQTLPAGSKAYFNTELNPFIQVGYQHHFNFHLYTAVKGGIGCENILNLAKHGRTSMSANIELMVGYCF